jgi:NADH dehydrogenase
MESGVSERPHVVIVGAGFGGLEAARSLAQSPVDVTVIDRHNYHLFQPLLYQVATAALSPADIAQPIRAILRHQQNATVLLDEVIGIDAAARQVETRFGANQSYEHLVLATGSQYAYYGHDCSKSARIFAACFCSSCARVASASIRALMSPTSPSMAFSWLR